MWNHLFKHIDIDPKNAHILDGNAPDLQAECDNFEKMIADAGGIRLFIGGLSHPLRPPRTPITVSLMCKKIISIPLKT